MKYRKILLKYNAYFQKVIFLQVKYKILLYLIFISRIIIMLSSVNPLKTGGLFHPYIYTGRVHLLLKRY